MDTGADIDKNMQKSLRFIKQAKAKEVELLVFPENFLYIGPNHSFHFTIDSHSIKAIRIQAKESQLNIIGCFPIFNKGRVYNQAILIDKNGEIAATYSKIHLFKAQLNGQETYNEPENYARGFSLAHADINGWKTGMAICFDLRFPVLFRKMALQGTHLVIVPSNFTVFTGRAHWLTLLKARAIENQLYIAAPNQVGRKGATRRSFGHSCIIDPWGDVLSLKSFGEGLVMADISKGRIDSIRKQLPSVALSKEQSFLR